MAPSFRYCPHCRAELSLRAIEGRDRTFCPACQAVFYENSKPCAGALVSDGEGRLLLARRAIAPFLGLWDIPGGYLEAGEHPEAGAVREVREETGLEVAITGFGGIYMDTYGEGGVSTLNAFYEARVVGGALSAQDDVSELAWFAPGDVPLDAFSFENGKQAIRDWLARRGHVRR
ncbi:MAG TPA: NUDIX hydrolase [Pantanalinema sp.]